MIASVRKILVVVVLSSAIPSALANNVITDWDEKAVAFVTPRMPPPATERAMAMVHTAMFDAANSIEQRYRPYLIQIPAAATASKEAAAATAGAHVLAGLVPQAEQEIRGAMAAYLAALPASDTHEEGIRVGEAVARKILETRARDGSNAADAYRPKTSPGVYVPTAITVLSMWPGVVPFGMASASQFRPAPPLQLGSVQWAADYNEIKDLGGMNSSKRSARQTEDAQFWAITGAQSVHPLARQLVAAKKMSVVDSARFMALVSIAAADAYIAVMDAKYHYEFWRPVTAIRNGDRDENSATERDPTWQPLVVTPMHPEYPCAHCIHSGAVAAAMEAVLGTAEVPELVMTSATATGVTHRWTNLWTLANEVAEARIWSGLHYRFSTHVGQEMGRSIGQYVVKNMMRPAAVAEAR
jgi:PAP2 superfamily protein